MNYQVFSLRKFAFAWNTVLLLSKVSTSFSFVAKRTRSRPNQPVPTVVSFSNDKDFCQCTESTTTSPLSARLFASRTLKKMQQRGDASSRRISSASPLHADLTMDDLEQPNGSSKERGLVASYPATSSSTRSWTERARHSIGLHVEKEGMSLRQRLTKMGIFAAMTYNIISQLNSGTTISVAWYIFSSRNGVSPLAPNQWRSFLAFYAGFWVFNNIMRPFRVAAAVALTPRMERLTLKCQEHFQLSRTKAITLTAIATYAAACTYSAFCMVMASACSGVPILATTTS